MFHTTGPSQRFLIANDDSGQGHKRSNLNTVSSINTGYSHRVVMSPFQS